VFAQGLGALGWVEGRNIVIELPGPTAAASVSLRPLTRSHA